MKLNTKKLLYMFVPLGVAFVVLSFGIDDLKHPAVSTDQCHFLGRGESVQTFKAEAKTLYKNSGKPEDDIGLQCSKLGGVLVNDDVPLPIETNQPITVKIKQYRFMPTRYELALPVVNTDDEELMTTDRNG